MDATSPRLGAWKAAHHLRDVLFAAHALDVAGRGVRVHGAEQAAWVRGRGDAGHGGDGEEDGLGEHFEWIGYSERKAVEDIGALTASMRTLCWVEMQARL